jgi:ribosomal-protein-alanine N-acetyltransferase
MDNITVRRADSTDIPALSALEKECFSLPWSEQSFYEFFALPYTVAYVAVSDGHICGYAGMYVLYGDGDITNIAVSRSFRRRGVGSALLRALIETTGVNRLLLEVRASNTAAIALYEKYGFITDCVRRGFYSHPTEDAILMSLNVTGENNADSIF